MIIVGSANAQMPPSGNESRTITRVLKDSTTMVALDLDASTVFCTDRGYGNVQLKVSVPDLSVLAHFDHRVIGENKPCITGGECKGTNVPSSILNPDKKIEVAPIRVILSQTLYINDENKTCSGYLLETINSYIRGIPFQHMREGELEPLDYEKCIRLQKL